MVFVADARECRFFMKPEVKPEAVLSHSISSSRRRFADVVVATWDLLCLHHVGWFSLPLVAHKLPPVGRTYVNINASYCSSIRDAYIQSPSNQDMSCTNVTARVHMSMVWMWRECTRITLPPFGMVFVADARECRFLMKLKVKLKVVL